MNVNQVQLGLFTKIQREEAHENIPIMKRLKSLNAFVEWEMFRPTLESALSGNSESPVGRPRYDCILMFKTLVLKKTFNLSFDETENEIRDRISYQKFLNLEKNDNVPDSKTIFSFFQKLTDLGLIDELFSSFNGFLEGENIISHKAAAIDSTMVEVPIQRNHREENKTIKEGNIPEGWLEDTPKAKHKLAQKDVDARWTKKHGRSYFGYKDHVKVDLASKLILSYEVTPASVHDSQVCSQLLDGNDKELYADSAYKGESIESKIPDGIITHICNRGYRGHPLTDALKAANHVIAKTRCRIEHVFGYMTESMHGITIRSIGIKRAKCDIGLSNLVYNMHRYCTLMRIEPQN